MSEASQQFPSTPRASPPTTRGRPWSTLPAKQLITPRRYDLAVKWRLFRHLLSGNDPDAVNAYGWHIENRIGPRMRAGLPTDQWKRSVNDYYFAAYRLCDSMRINGYLPNEPVPIDPDGELLGGAHRLACALALEIADIPVAHMPNSVWAPPWHREWFVEHGMYGPDLARLDADWAEMNA